MKHISKYLLITFYIVAGINHFVNPEFYLVLIPDYLPLKNLINYASGALEVIFGIGVAFDRFRNVSIYGILVLLMLFIPSHIYFIQIGSCVDGGLCVPPWIAWVRLILVHPLLMFWAWAVKVKS